MLAYGRDCLLMIFITWEIKRVMQQFSHRLYDYCHMKTPGHRDKTTKIDNKKTDNEEDTLEYFYLQSYETLFVSPCLCH